MSRLSDSSEVLLVVWNRVSDWSVAVKGYSRQLVIGGFCGLRHGLRHGLPWIRCAIDGCVLDWNVWLG